MRIKCKYKYVHTIIVRELEDGEIPKLDEFEFTDEKYLYRTQEIIDDGVLIDIKEKKDINGDNYFVGIVVCTDGKLCVFNFGDLTIEEI